MGNALNGKFFTVEEARDLEVKALTSIKRTEARGRTPSQAQVKRFYTAVDRRMAADRAEKQGLPAVAYRRKRWRPVVVIATQLA